MDPNRNPEVARGPATRIFIHAFPLVLADTIRRAHPMAAHQFHTVADCPALAPGMSDEDPRVIVSSAWIDLSHAPVILNLPATRGRHFTLTLIDTAGEVFASCGSRTGEDAGQMVALADPAWCGELPSGLKAKRAPSSRVWAVARHYAHSQLDMKATFGIVQRLEIGELDGTLERTPMSTLDPPTTPCLQQAADLSPAAFFQRLDRLMRGAPSTSRATLAAIEALRKEIGGPPIATTWSVELEQVLQQGLRDAVAIMQAGADLFPEGEGLRPASSRANAAGPPDPVARAAQAWRLMGAPAPEDLLVLYCHVDSEGRPLNGQHGYRLHIRADAMPPARAFWWLHTDPGPPHGYLRGVGDRSQLATDPDGSVEIFIQATPPAPERLTNWLPCPRGDFSVHLALHLPMAWALNRAWRMPALELFEEAPAPPDRSGDGRRPAPGASAWRIR
jgi:hypothetical protein